MLDVKEIDPGYFAWAFKSKVHIHRPAFGNAMVENGLMPETSTSAGDAGGIASSSSSSSSALSSPAMQQEILQLIDDIS